MMELCSVLLIALASGGTVKSNSTATLALAGMKDNAERIESGVFRASGRKIRTRLPSNNVEVLEFSFYGAFDHDRGTRRLDRTVKAASGVHAPSTVYKTVLAPSYTIYWNDQTGGIAAVDQPMRSEDLPLLYQPFFDTRVMAAMYYDRLSMTLADLYSWLHERPDFRDAVKRPGAVYEISWYRTESLEVYTLSLDATRGFTPIKLDIRVPGSPKARVAAEAGYQQENGVWVIQSFHITDHKIGTVAEMDLVFDWESVNAPISPGLFDWPGMEIEDGTGVYDYRLGKDKKVLLGYVGQPGSRGVLLMPSESRGRWRVAVGLVAAIVLGACVGYVMKKRR